MQNVRYNVSPCSPAEAIEFIGKIDKSVYLPRGAFNADERSHYDRFTFMREESKVAVVYDTSANVISITAPENYADELLALFAPAGRAVKRSLLPAQSVQKRDGQYRRTEPYNGGVAVPTSSDTRSKLFVSPENIRRRPEIKTTTVIMTAKGVELSTDEIFPPQSVKRRVPDNIPDADSAHVGGSGRNEYTGYRRDGGRDGAGAAVKRDGANGYVKSNVGGYKPNAANYGRDGIHVNAAMPEQRKASSVDEYFKGETAKPPAKRPVGRPRKATISFGDEDEDNGKTLPERPRSGTGLYADIAARASASPQTSYEEPTEKRKRGRPRKETATADIVMSPEIRERQSARSGGKPQTFEGKSGTKAFDAKLYAVLKKRLPTACLYLSEQSRSDLICGLQDFAQNRLTLSDYSVLLVPPFRGLERFIFDLQRAEGIKVKMIGQAYDKDSEGHYILKHGYCQRIGSVIYAEVMVALYTEYFSRRNFFAHSDNSDDSRSRAIPDRTMAKNIFDNLLNVIEYNAKKLKEIGFSMSPDDM